MSCIAARSAGFRRSFEGRNIFGILGNSMTVFRICVPFEGRAWQSPVSRLQPVNKIQRLRNDQMITNQIPERHPRLARILLIGSVAMGFLVTNASFGTAQQFAGALWSFHMTSKDPSLGKKSGTFRVEGARLFQSGSESDRHRSLQVGTKQPLEKDTTRLNFSVLIGKSGKVIARGAHATIEFHKFGEWSGRLIDGEGNHWSFKCSRIAD